MSDYVVLMIAYIHASLIGSHIGLYSVPCNIDWEEFQAVFVLTFAAGGWLIGVFAAQRGKPRFPATQSLFKHCHIQPTFALTKNDRHAFIRSRSRPVR